MSESIIIAEISKGVSRLISSMACAEISSYSSSLISEAIMSCYVVGALPILGKASFFYLFFIVFCFLFNTHNIFVECVSVLFACEEIDIATYH